MIQSLAVDPNSGAILKKSKAGIFLLAANLKTEAATGIASDPFSELTIDCRSNVYVLSTFSGGVAKYAPSQPVSSCQAQANLPAKALTLAPPRVKTVGPRETAVVQPVTCRVQLQWDPEGRHKGPIAVDHRPGQVPRSRRAEAPCVLPLTGHGQSLAAHGGVLNVSVTAIVTGSNVPRRSSAGS